MEEKVKEKQVDPSPSDQNPQPVSLSEVKLEPMSKNQRKKEAKKKNKNKKEIFMQNCERNKSKIKCPRQLETEGLMSHLSHIRLKNYNPISAYSSKM